MRIVIDIDPATGTAELARTETTAEATPTSSNVAAAIDAGACAGLPTLQLAPALSGQVDRPAVFSIPPAPHADTFDAPGMSYASNGLDAGSPPT
jgi:hypothetical protein